MHTPRIDSELESVRIERLAAGGDGIGRLADGRTVFVALTAPGDVARVRVFESRKRYAKAELIEVESPGASRREPSCEAFGTCGGCDWQHLNYDAQVEAKRSLISDAIERIARLEVPESFVFHPSPAEFGYRSRARVLVTSAGVGFRKRGSHELCAVSSCPVLAPELNERLEDARCEAAGSEVELVVGSVPSGSVGVTEFSIGDDRLRISEGVFAQANAMLHTELVSSVLAAAGTGDTACELYAGAGLFTLGLSRAFERVIAIEVNARATEDLAFNLERARRANVDIVTRAVDRALGRVRRAAPQAVILDPPRIGLDAGVAAQLADCGAQRIVYLSCNPATLARDIKTMSERGYALCSLEGFDLFPQTAHVEALAVLHARAG